MSTSKEYRQDAEDFLKEYRQLKLANTATDHFAKVWPKEFQQAANKLDSSQSSDQVGPNSS
jgi:hypothetical protein